MPGAIGGDHSLGSFTSTLLIDPLGCFSKSSKLTSGTFSPGFSGGFVGLESGLAFGEVCSCAIAEIYSVHPELGTIFLGDLSPARRSRAYL